MENVSLCRDPFHTLTLWAVCGKKQALSLMVRISPRRITHCSSFCDCWLQHFCSVLDQFQKNCCPYWSETRHMGWRVQDEKYRSYSLTIWREKKVKRCLDVNEVELKLICSAGSFVPLLSVFLLWIMIDLMWDSSCDFGKNLTVMFLKFSFLSSASNFMNSVSYSRCLTDSNLTTAALAGLRTSYD